MDIEKFAENAGFEISAIYKQRVHRSLTRTITVLQK
jgi:tRNA G10  N-methylase Trm11